MKKINICLMLFLCLSFNNSYGQASLEDVRDNWVLLNDHIDGTRTDMDELIACVAMKKFIQPEQEKLNSHCKNNPEVDCRSHFFIYKKFINDECPAGMFYGYTILRDQVQVDVQASVKYMKAKAQKKSFEWRDLIATFKNYKNSLPVVSDESLLVLKFYHPENVLTKEQMFFLHIALDDLESSSNIFFGQVNETQEEKLMLKYFKVLYGVSKIDDKNKLQLNKMLFDYEQILKYEVMLKAEELKLLPQSILNDLKNTWFTNQPPVQVRPKVTPLGQ